MEDDQLCDDADVDRLERRNALLQFDEIRHAAEARRGRGIVHGIRDGLAELRQIEVVHEFVILRFGDLAEKIDARNRLRSGRGADRKIVEDRFLTRPRNHGRSRHERSV